MPSTARSKSLTADGVTSALINDCERLAATIGERAMTRPLGDAMLYIFGVPAPSMNGVMMRRASATVADVASLLEIIEGRGLPHCLQVRPGRREEIVELVKARGMVEDEPLPLMAMGRELDALRRTAQHPTLTVRVLKPDEAGLHYSVAAEGYEAPIGIFEALVPPAVMRLPGLRVYVGTVDGEPVTTALGSTLGEFVGVFDVATPARYRGRGYGAAITALAVLDGFEDGATFAYLQSSAMGFKIYERLGFRTLETWSVWVSAPSHS